MKPYLSYFEKIRIRRDPQAEVKSHAPVCQWDGCDAPGTHKAPVGRMKEGEYFRFCIDHVRYYNKGFNYFSGVPDSDVARFQKEALTGHRPTWKMGANATAKQSADFSQARSGSAASHARTRDTHNFFGGGRRAEPRERKLKSLEAKAMETLGLAANATGADIKARYKELVKRHHPDANGGDRSSEARLSEVLQAYKVLKQAGFC